MRPLTTEDSEADFRCAKGPTQVEFLKVHALSGQQSDLSRTYVLPGSADGPALQGFYALCMGRVTSSDLPSDKSKNSQQPSPAALLAQLARDDRAARGVGKDLVLDALTRILRLADQIGCCGALLHAGTTDLIPYYLGLGFIQIGKTDAPKPQMWMSMKNIRATFDAVEREPVPPDATT